MRKCKEGGPDRIQTFFSGKWRMPSIRTPWAISRHSQKRGLLTNLKTRRQVLGTSSTVTWQVRLVSKPKILH